MILMLIPFVVLGIGLVCGGRPAALRDVPLRGVPVVVLAFAAQWLVLHTESLLASTARVGVLGAAHAAVIGFLLVNEHLPGARWMLAGALLNAVVIGANGGFMPVAPATLAAAQIGCSPCLPGTLLPGSKDILLPPDQAIWPWLGDSLPLAGYVVSPGDCLLAAGLGILVWRGMRAGDATRSVGKAAPPAPRPASLPRTG